MYYALESGVIPTLYNIVTTNIIWLHPLNGRLIVDDIFISYLICNKIDKSKHKF